MCDGVVFVTYIDFRVVASGRRGGPVAGNVGCPKFGLDECRHIADDYVSLAEISRIPECTLAEFCDRLADSNVGEVVACTESVDIYFFAGIIDYDLFKAGAEFEGTKPDACACFGNNKLRTEARTLFEEPLGYIRDARIEINRFQLNTLLEHSRANSIGFFRKSQLKKQKMTE